MEEDTNLSEIQQEFGREIGKLGFERERREREREGVRETEI